MGGGGMPAPRSDEARALKAIGWDRRNDRIAAVGRTYGEVGDSWGAGGSGRQILYPTGIHSGFTAWANQPLFSWDGFKSEQGCRQKSGKPTPSRLRRDGEAVSVSLIET